MRAGGAASSFPRVAQLTAIGSVLAASRFSPATIPRSRKKSRTGRRVRTRAALAEMNVDDRAAAPLPPRPAHGALAEIFLLLDAAETARRRRARRRRAVAAADVLWRELCVKGQHGASLQFKEMLGTLAPGRAPRREEGGRRRRRWRRRLERAAAGGAPEQLDVVDGDAVREVYFRSLDTLKNTVCIDMGRGYAKYGLANGTPAMIQICQPNAEATADSLASLAFRRLNLRRSDLPNLAAIVAEPFRLASSRVDNERQSWRHDVERKYLQYLGSRSSASSTRRRSVSSPTRSPRASSSTSASA